MKLSYWIFSLALLVSGGLLAQQAPVNAKKGVAIYGYDVVSYWEGEPVKGIPEYRQVYQGSNYYFTNSANKEKFATDPEKYLPEFGGYCAYAMAKTGGKVNVNPLAYEIRDGRLLLFYKQGLTDTLDKWQEEGPEALLQKADRNWGVVVAKE